MDLIPFRKLDYKWQCCAKRIQTVEGTLDPVPADLCCKSDAIIICLCDW